MRMKTTAPSLALMLLAAAAWAPLAAQDAADLNGGWLLRSFTSAEGEVTQITQRGIYVFGVWNETGGHYSRMNVNGSDPRPEYEDEMSDEERLAAYGSFTANSGQLVVEGNTVTMIAYVAKDPNYMGNFPDNGVSLTWAVNGETLTLTQENGAFLTLRRPGA